MDNPLLEQWKTPFGLPPFDRIEVAHFQPAFDAAIAGHKAEIAAIAAEEATPDFANTIEALERAGDRLDKVAGVFFTLSSSDTTEALQKIEREIAPVLSRHGSAMLLNQDLARRVFSVSDQGLDAEQARVLK
ncbi:MAG: peptidase M3, partial [Pseudomonadota bacterium]